MGERIALRLPTWLLQAVDGEIIRKKKRHPEAVVNRSDIVREILGRALAQYRPRDEAGNHVRNR